MNRRLLCCIGLVGLLGCARQPPATALSQAVPRQVQVQPYRPGAACNHDRVMVGPNGTEVAVWASDSRYVLAKRLTLPPNEVMVGRMHGPDRSASNLFFSYGGNGLRLFPIRWSRRGEGLFARLREPQERVVALDPEGGGAVERAGLDPAWALVDIGAVSHGDVAVLSERTALERARRIDGSTFIRGSATLGSTVELLGARRDDFELVRIDEGAGSSTGINAGQTRWLTAFPDAGEYAAGISFVGAAMQRENADFLPYQLPVVDLSTGRVTGRFGPTRIDLRQEGSLGPAMAELHRRLAGGGAVILDVSRSGDVLMVLTLAVDGERRLTRVSRHGLSDQSICTPESALEAQGRGIRPRETTNDRSLAAVQVSAVAIDAAGAETHASGRPIVVRYSLPGDGPRDAILYFHGGPGATLADGYWPKEVQELLRPDRDVVAVEYSSSQGGGAALTRRLAERGLPAIEEDVDAAMRWLERRQYRRTYVIGGSFGGVPALVALDRHRQAISGSFFIVPMLRLQNPEQWAEVGSGFNPVGVDTQLIYEHAYYGGPEGRTRFAEGLAELLSRAPLTAADHFYFAENDPMSRPEHLPDRIPSSQRVIPRTLHATISGRSVLWRDIEERMQ